MNEVTIDRRAVARWPGPPMPIDAATRATDPTVLITGNARRAIVDGGRGTATGAATGSMSAAPSPSSGRSR